MAKSNKRRAGLQKKVSSVFEGVSIPGSRHKDRSDRKPSPPRAASEIPKPSDNQTCQDPVVTRPDQPDESVGRTVPAHFTTPLPSTSTNHESSQSPEVGRIDQPEDVAEGTVPEYVAATTPSISTNSEDSQGPAVGKIDKSEESADKTVSERLAASPEPETEKRQSSQSSLLKRMAECEETLREPVPVKAKEVSRESAPVKTKEASCKPSLAGTVESLRKTAPVEQLKSNPFAETSGPSLGQQIRDKIATSRLGTGTAKDKVMALLVPVLAIVMIFMFRQVLSKSPGEARGAAADDAPAVVAANAGDEIEWELPEPMPVAMRDPTKMPSQDDTQSEAPDNIQKPGQNGATSGTQKPAIRIRGLVYSQKKPSIVVGNEILHVGDKVNGITITRINKDSVEFEKDGETWIQKVRD